MKISLFLFVALLVGNLAQAKWVDPEEEAKRNHRIKAWQGVEFTFTGVSSSGGTSALVYHTAVNDLAEWNAGAGVDSLGFFLTGGGRYYFYNDPHTTCFFTFSCHGQVMAGMNLSYAEGGRKTYTNDGLDSIYNQGNSMYAWPTIGFRSIYKDFFSLGLEVGYRFMVQNAGISRTYGNYVQSNVDDMSKLSNNGLGASLSIGIVF